MGNSSSTPSSSTTTTTTHGEYDVFLSFRGTDTRKSFTSHLYRALHEKEITTFIDDKLIRGEEISEGLLSAIGESKISVIIFSKNYAFSRWCLRELAEIMKYEEMNKQIVIPVFYHVDPSHVRKQIESYEAAFAKHDQNESEEEVQKWRGALTRASNLSGWDSSVARNEAELVCDIVRDVWNKLYNISPSCDFEDLVKGLVGIEEHIAGVVSKLCLEVQDFRIIGIWGMGGMGKTTIADVVFHIISNQFENRKYFTSSVRAESEKDSNGLIRLRNKILSKVLNIEKNKTSDSPNIPQDLKKMLLQKKVLIVFDDVDRFEQLETLVGDLDRLGPGSRIIVTTRDKQVLRNCRVKDHNMYEVKGLNDDETLKLFCKHAFKQNHPTKDFEDLSTEMVKIATDVPLAIRVLGSLLHTRRKQYWEDAVDQFQGIMNPTIFDRLKISYNGLDKEEKGLFLDIACFVDVFAFERYEENITPKLLSNRTCFLDNLIDKSLVTVDCGYIKMHDLLREMGMKIASENRSRLWRQEDVLRTLEHNDGTDAVQGIFLNMFKLKDVCLSFQALMKMYNLTTLIINHEEHLCNGGLDYLPNELRYLHWNFYPLKVLPSSLNPENLVELDLSYSKTKQLWEESTWVPKLKWLNLVYCKNLISIPDLSNIPSAEIINLKYCSTLIEIHSSRECPKLKWLNLLCCWSLISIPDLSNIPSAEIINLNYCSSLIEIHSSRECPKNLHSLQLEGCKSLSRLPSNIHLSEEPSFSTSVVLHSSKQGLKFSLRECFRLTKFPHISGNIKSLDLSGTGVEEVPSTIESLSKLERLNMNECRNLKRISESICKLKSLHRLDLSGCCKLESFPDISERMELKYLNLSGTAIKELPPSIENLNRLEELDLSDCKNLETFPSSISTLNLYGCSKLEKLNPLSGLCSLKILRLNRCYLTEISEDIGCLSSLERLELEGNFKVGKLPKSIKKLSKLYHLSISSCPMLRSLPELPSSLRYLAAMDCTELIQSLPDVSEIELCTDGCGSFFFNFMNCRELNQKAVRNLFRVSVLKMQLMGTEKVISLLPPSRFCSINTRTPPDEEVKVNICLPGSEIPEWFCYKNSGSSINIPGLRNDCGRSSYIMGFEVCLVIGLEDYMAPDYICDIDVYYDFHIETSDGLKEGFVCNPFQLSGMLFLCSDHILLGYNLSRKCYEFFQELDTLLANHGMSDYVGTSFKFNIHSREIWEGGYSVGSDCEVKYCGIQPIYTKTQVMNSVSFNQDAGDTSGCNDTVEETCEPHPKRISTEANQFS